MKKTLGGDRLGSGKKMQVELHGYERSTHDLSYMWRSSMSAGTLVPFMCEVALPGDTFDINLDATIMTHPTLGPLFGSYKVQLDVFEAPMRLYNSLLHNNMLGIGLDMSKVKLPTITLEARKFDVDKYSNIDNEQINPSCLLSYLGIRGVGFTNEDNVYRTFNGLPLLAYWEIYKNYYSNKQEEIGVVVHSNPANYNPMEIEKIEILGADGLTVITEIAEYADAPTGMVLLETGQYIQIKTAGGEIYPPYLWFVNTGENNVYSFQALTNPLGNNNVFVEIAPNTWRAPILYNFGAMPWPGSVVVWWRALTNAMVSNNPISLTKFNLSDIDQMRKNILSFSSEVEPFNIFFDGLEPYTFLESPTNIRQSQEGLGVKTYQSDLLNNWLKTEYIDNINERSAISTITGSITIDQINLARKVYEMLNRIAVSGGTYDDWLDAVYTHERIQRAESPIYHGGLIKELVFQEVVSQTGTENQPLGSLAGKGTMARKHKGGNIVIKVSEPSYIMGIISLTPRIDYSQGNKWDTWLQTIDDLHKPQLDEIGFQDLITEQMAWFDTEWDGTKWVQKSAGKQPAWLNYMTNVNRTYGNFAIENNEMFMTLNRRYEHAFNGNEITDVTSYIDPAKYNFIFAETSLDSQNFWAQVSCDITARRKMSAKVMPNL